ncbi:type II secretion system F family protein [Halorientalis pallida]|uniref:Flagella assembly protein j n=1 Tax=Halorientalis pallida TaxID=2479928 RepID=A0A498KW39_9EURY|nr:type II secretion system F family protein [Halorientalis pallida]RXK49468.1 flagella assembly protein j [Halorientalis pallida]
MSLDTRSGQTVGSTSTLGDTFYPLYESLFDSEGDFVSGVENKLAQARMPQNVELFLSRALGVGALAGLTLWIVGSLLGYLIFALFLPDAPVLLGLSESQIPPILLQLKIPFLVFVTGIVFGLIGFGIGFGSMVSIPYFRAGARKREINVLLSDSISFMYALSVGGLNQLEILQAMARADDTYGEVSKEFQSIVLETEYFDTDYRTAIRNQALQTPSDELAQFLTDMLSIVDSGGDMTGFLEDQKEKHMRTAKQEQEMVLETMELFGEMYMTLSLFPLLLIIILVIMSMMGNSQQFLLLGTVYGLIPLTGVGFLVLVSTVTQDEIGDGYLRPEGGRDDVVVREGLDVLNLGLVEKYTGDHGVFEKIKSRERSYELSSILRRPHIFFRDNPTVVLGLTIPISLVAVVLAVLYGFAPLSPEGFVENPVGSTFFWFYVPLYVNFVPLMIFYEWNVRARRGVVSQLSENLRKLSSANDTGMTLLESLNVVSETSSGKLSDEFETMYAKVNYGTNLKDALREFNNKYHIPRLARTVKLISKAQEASSQIEDVLTTAAQASENQDDIDRDRKSRTRMQVVIIIMTYLTLLGVMALLKTQFLDVMSGLANQVGSGGGGSSAAAGGGQFGSNVDTGLLSVLFFHAVTLQAVLSSFIAGYIREVDLISGVKFAVILPTIALITWMAVG